jgi:hypothetical protein
MWLFESQVKANVCIHELNQEVEHKLRHLRLPNHGTSRCKQGIDTNIWRKIRGPSGMIVYKTNTKRT